MGNSYVERDIVALRQKIIKSVQDMVSKTTSEWTDFNESDLGMVYVEVLASCVDFLNYYLDKQANEVFLDRAEEPKNIMSILNTMGYRIPLRTSAEGRVKFSRPEVYGFDIIIPNYSQLSTSTKVPKYFVTKGDYRLSTNQEFVEIPIIQGKRKDVKITYSQVSKSWKYYLSDSEVADHSVIVEDANGKWEEVEDAFLQYRGGRYFSLHKDADDRVYIQFTWDWKDQFPREGDIKITYIVTLADEGSVSEFAVDNIVDVLYDTKGNSVSNLLVVRNTLPVTGGSKEPDICKSIVDAKANIKTMSKLITLEDYSSFVNAYPGVFKACIQDWSVPGTSVNKPYQVIAFLASESGIPYADDFLDNFSALVMSKGVAITDFKAKNCDVVNANIKAKIKIRSDNEEFRETLRLRVISELESQFAWDKREFGENLYFYDVRDAIRKVSSQITEVIVEEPSELFEIIPAQIIRVNSIEIEVVGDIYGV